MASYARTNVGGGHRVNLDLCTVLFVTGSGSSWSIESNSVTLAGVYPTQVDAQAALDAYVVAKGEVAL